MREITSRTLVLGIAAAATSCGGGGGASGTGTPAIADPTIPIVAAGPGTAVAPSDMSLRILAAVPPPDTSQLFDWAEAHFPQFFPSHQANQFFATYAYRFYPETGNYMGVDGGVFARVMGPSFGPDIVTVGAVTDFTCDVTPQVCAPAAAPAAAPAPAPAPTPPDPLPPYVLY